jgi:4a-hydroxytetrahydrobiopterin dehydratase
MKTITPHDLNAFLNTTSAIRGKKWCILQGKLYISLQFDTFIEAFSAMTAIALYAEKIDHHPEWHNTHTRLDIYLCTHDAGGITHKDLDLAKAITQLLENSTPRA